MTPRGVQFLTSQNPRFGGPENLKEPIGIVLGAGSLGGTVDKVIEIVLAPRGPNPYTPPLVVRKRRPNYLIHPGGHISRLIEDNAVQINPSEGIGIVRAVEADLASFGGLEGGGEADL